MIEYHFNWWIESIKKIFNFKLIWSHKFFQTDLNRNNWVNDLIHSKFNGIDWNWFIWWLKDLNEIFFSEFEWIEMILHNLESNIQMKTITISSMIKLKNNQILSIIVKSLWNRMIDEATCWNVLTEFNGIIKQQHILYFFKLSFFSYLFQFIPIDNFNSIEMNCQHFHQID